MDMNMDMDMDTMGWLDKEGLHFCIGCGVCLLEWARLDSPPSSGRDVT
jgi:hypothetical protein